MIELAYTLYLSISLGMTVCVAQTLSTNGRIFLIDGFDGNEKLAGSVNHMLVVGFYLVNLGYVTLALRYGTKPGSTVEVIEFLSTKIGLVLLVLGLMHFFNVRVIMKWGRSAAQDRAEKVTKRRAEHAAKDKARVTV